MCGCFCYVYIKNSGTFILTLFRNSPQWNLVSGMMRPSGQ